MLSLGPIAAATAAIAAAAYAWFVTGLTPFSWPLGAAVALPILVVLSAAVGRRGRRVPLLSALGGLGPGLRRAVRAADPDARTSARVAVLWAALILLLAAVQLYAYFSGWGAPRREYPTLSWILGHVEWRAARSALFVGWVAAGVYLVRR